MTTCRLQRLLIAIIALTMAAAVACSGGMDESLSTGSDGRAPGDWTNNASGGNEGNNDNNGNNYFEPEVPVEFEFAAPAVIGDSVYIANETLNSVAVIDSRTLAVKTILAGFRPTVVAGPEPAHGTSTEARVMALNQGSSTVTIINPADFSTRTVPVLTHANALKMDPTGRFGVVWYDDAQAEPGNSAGDLSSVSIVTADQSFQVAVGFHVQRVQFDRDGHFALILTEDGVSRIELGSLAGDGFAPPVSVLPLHMSHLKPLDMEVLLTPDGQYAITRTTEWTGLVLLDIVAGEQHLIALPEIPTDIELFTAPGGAGLELLVMLRTRNQLVRATVPEGLLNAAEWTATQATQTGIWASTHEGDAGHDDAGEGDTGDVGVYDVGNDIDDGDAGTDVGEGDAGTDVGEGDAGEGDAGEGDVGEGDAGTDVGEGDAGEGDAGEGDVGEGDAGTGDAGEGDAGTGADAGDIGTDDPIVWPNFDGFVYINVIVPRLGAAGISGDGSTALLFSTLNDEKRAVLFDLTHTEPVEAQRGLVFEKGLRGTLADVRGQTFLVFHTRQEGQMPSGVTPTDPEYINRSWGVSIVDINSSATRLVLTEQEPGPTTLWAPEVGDTRVYMIFKLPEFESGIQDSHRDVVSINLRSFRQDSFRVANLPEGLGPIAGAGKVYISQTHPQGRITFVDVETRDRQTVTGYQLNAGIE